MAGMEGYFGPRAYNPNSSYREIYNDLEYERQIFRGTQRPNSIDLQQTFPKQIPNTVYEDDDAQIQKFIGVGIGVTTLITENLLSHPFLVLRRQCQVNHNAKRFHLVPFTLFPVIVHLHRSQSITTLWKGIGSVLLIRGMALAVEDIVSKVTNWPKEISWTTVSWKTMGQHILLKCITLAVITPFYSASLVETVQSDIASEKPGVFDVFREGIYRLVNISNPQKGRMLPVWSLVVPTVVHGAFKCMFQSLIKNFASACMQINCRQEFERKGAYPKDWMNQSLLQEIEVTAQLISLIGADVLFYPLETILHRLHLQGTRTIIDNLDNGFSVVAILTRYEGMVDCYDTTMAQEGGAGLFKGFGALILQFSAHYAVLKLTKLLFTQVATFVKSSSPPPPPIEKLRTPVKPECSKESVRTPMR
ncbi:mitochondrial outer membrane protein SLC25A46 [Halyomorpha halys]|uniref:mitochondrial outer membrane protein SLC25A46 n=1 Tax=Halyomorpha halys TaxID=286706 RepID=UPI0006D4D2C8|nr:solute carrier family 25 member 46-like [Halyomorpha halys]